MVDEPVVGFVTEVGTRTSHTSIMARALEIPAVVGVTSVVSRISTGDLIIVDGLRGAVIVRPSTPGSWRRRSGRAARHTALARGLPEARDRPPTTKDGVAAQASAPTSSSRRRPSSRATRARRASASTAPSSSTSIARSPPTEDEQYEIFKAVVEATRPKPVTLRTFDIGGDKFASTFKVPPEMNPMLGLRAVRLALSRPDVFIEHLRAMVRASAHGEVRIMVPMVASLVELREVRALVARARAEVRAEGHALRRARSRSA